MIAQFYSFSLQYLVFLLFAGAMFGLLFLTIFKRSFAKLSLFEISNAFFVGISIVAGFILVLAAADKKLAELLYNHSTVLLACGLYVSLSALERVFSMFLIYKKV